MAFISDTDALLANIDKLIESYDYESDPILQEHFTPLQDKLCGQIKRYGEPDHNYGDVLAAHLERTSSLGQRFLKEKLGFSAKAARNFYHANLLQDLGKTHPCYNAKIWQTPHRPTPEEREEKREHTRLGVELIDLALLKAPKELQRHPHIRVAQSIQQHHHERMDGTGYEGIKGDKLGQIIKAICIIDAYDGDMIARPHQPAKRTPAQALQRMKKAKKYQSAFDPQMLDRFTDFIDLSRVEG